MRSLLTMGVWLGLAFGGILAMQSAGYAQVPAAPKDGRVWHVSPLPLPGVALISQFRTINEAAKIVQAGDTVLIHSGVYREAVKVEKSGTTDRPITFKAAPAANVVITGADRITDWTKEPAKGNIYSTPWSHVFLGWSPTRTHPDDDYHLLIGRCEQVFAAGFPLHQVLKREEMSRGSFFVDEPGKRLYAWSAGNDNMSNILVEASARPVIWQSQGANIVIRGIRFRYAANAAQQGAVILSGAHDTAVDCIFEKTNAIGAAFTGQDIIIQHCTFQDNGQMGFGASGAHNLLFTRSLVRNNNIKNFSRGWEAGGDKICLSRGVIIEQSQFLDNKGTGVWFDIGNEDCVVRNCFIANNDDAGIFNEISYGLQVYDNVLIGNGLAGTNGAWGGAAGICLSSSPGSIIERNLLIGNKEGFNFREQNRMTPRIGDPPNKPESYIWNHDQIIRNNVIAYNRDAQSWGWFDVDDQRHWPTAMQDKAVETGKSAADMAAEYQAKTRDGQPVGLSLEKLNIKFSDNLYAVEDGEELFNWGTTWNRNKRYSSLDDVRKELNMEQGSRCEPVVFGDYHTHDFRMPADSSAIKMGCYPQGTIPEVQLGILPN